MNEMRKQRIVVPKGVRYISEWEDYKLENYNFPHILNKVLTGCGFTEYCLRNDQNIILVSPRKFLLENKEDQHPDEIYYARNELSKVVDYELNIAEFHKDKLVNSELTNEEIKLSILRMKEGIEKYINRRTIEKKPKKILVTYDSFRHVKDFLTEKGLFKYYQVVIDEFQSIFIDSRFKSDTELELLGYLEDVQKLCYVSATPMLDKYLDMLDEFKNLPYLELDWETEDPGRIIKPKLEIRFTGKSLNEEAKRVIESYTKGNYESRISEDGGIIESKEATLFMNSVRGICQVIRSCNLHIDQCNILCARTEKNESDVRKAFNSVLAKETEDLKKHPKIPKDYEVIGRIPKRGETHKQFTFCTRTVYLGADFYSTNSRTFIFSDSNIDCLSVDISMDLEQILGRQRLECNPWKNSARLYVRTTKKDKAVSPEEFKSYMDKKVENSFSLLTTYDRALIKDKQILAKTYEFEAKHNYYKNNYVAVNCHSGSSLKPVFNRLVQVSEIRTYEVQQIDYKDRFSVFNTIKDSGYIDNKDDVSIIVKEFETLRTTVDKFKYLVKLSNSTEITEQQINNFLAQIPTKYGEYYRLLGPDRIQANGYLETRLKKEWIKIHSEVVPEEEMISTIYSTFKVGEKYSKSGIKTSLKDIYNKYNYQKTAKASDLEEYFVLKSTSALNNGKWVHGFEILGKR